MIRHTGSMARLVFGELHANDSWRLETLQAACQGAGIDAVLSPAIAAEIWRKFLFLAPFAGSTCLAARPDRRRARGPGCCGRSSGHGRRGRRGGAGPRRRPAARGSWRSGLGSPAGLPAEMRSSMLHDLEAGRRLELDWLTGAVVRLGEAAGVATPASLRGLRALAPFRMGRPGSAGLIGSVQRTLRPGASKEKAGMVTSKRSPWSVTIW